MDHFSGFDFLILGIFFFSTLLGFSRGIITEILSLLVWIVAFYCASMFSGHIASMFMTNAQVQAVLSSASSSTGINPTEQVSWLAIGISFLIIFLTTMLVGTVIVRLIGSAFYFPGVFFVNRLLGAIFGFLRGILINVIFIFLIQLIPNVKESQAWQQSVLVPQFQPAIDWMEKLVMPSVETLKSKLGGTLDDVNSKLRDAMDKL